MIASLRQAARPRLYGFVRLLASSGFAAASSLAVGCGSAGGSCASNSDCAADQWCDQAGGVCVDTGGGGSGGSGATGGGGGTGGTGGTGGNGGTGGSGGSTGGTPGDGACSGGENAQNTPQDCPAVSGDGFCTHSENASSRPQDCPAVSGDGFCTHTENASTRPQDCPAVSGDGLCTHSENAASHPSDCPAVAGDGSCTHGENASTTPQDCPAVAGDGFCTHAENASTTPQDCPAVAGDGFCTHGENHVTAPGDCPPPDVTFAGGDLDDLRARSSNLVFGDLTITGALELVSDDGDVTLVAENITVAVGGSIDTVYQSCDWSASPNLTLIAADTVAIRGVIDLHGKPGVQTTTGNTCNDCDGANGGDFNALADRIIVASGVYTYGGGGSNDSMSVGGELYRFGCDGGHGGQAVFEAVSRIDVEQGFASTYGGTGGPSSHGGDPGGDGNHGAYAFLAPVVDVFEREPNGTIGLSYGIPFVPMTIHANISSTDDAARQNDATALWHSDPQDYFEDVYTTVFPFTTARSCTVSLDGANTTADLDMYMINPSSLSILAYSNGPTGDESFQRIMQPGQVVLLAVSWVGGATSTAYTITVQCN